MREVCVRLLLGSGQMRSFRPGSFVRAQFRDGHPRRCSNLKVSNVLLLLTMS